MMIKRLLMKFPLERLTLGNRPTIAQEHSNFALQDVGYELLNHRNQGVSIWSFRPSLHDEWVALLLSVILVESHRRLPLTADR